MGRSKPKKKYATWAHGCTGCGWRYADTDQWLPRDENGRCQRCTHGHCRTETELSSAPRECCLAGAELVVMTKRAGETQSQRDRLKLGGPKDMRWFWCPACWRTFPFKNPGLDNNVRTWTDELAANERQRLREEQERQRRDDERNHHHTIAG